MDKHPWMSASLLFLYYYFWMASDSHKMRSGHVSKKTLKWKAQKVTKTATNAAKRVFKYKKTSDIPEQESDAKTATTKSSSTPCPLSYQKHSCVEIVEEMIHPWTKDLPIKVKNLLMKPKRNLKRQSLVTHTLHSCKKKLISIIECLQNDWNTLIYAFYQPVPDIGYDNKGCHYHEFWCAAKGCKKGVHHCLATGDAKSMGNLWKHAKICWGVTAVELADQTKDVNTAQESVWKLKNGLITGMFKWIGEGKVIYSHWQHTKMEMK